MSAVRQSDLIIDPFDYYLAQAEISALSRQIEDMNRARASLVEENRRLSRLVEQLRVRAQKQERAG